MTHKEQHPMAGVTLRIKEGVTDPLQKQVVGGAKYTVEDWWDRLTGKSWALSDGNPAAMQYGMRLGLSENSTPLDDEVVYGKIVSDVGGFEFGHLVHVTELEEAT